MSEDIKYQFANALVLCMKEKTTLNKISITKLCKVAHKSRQTFYRNFDDLNDLLSWYFDKLLLKSFAEMGYGRTIKEGLIRKFKSIKEERIFFEVAFRNDDYHNLKDHDFEMIVAFYKDLIVQKTNQPCNKHISSLLEMYCSASIYMTVDWVLKGMVESEEDLAQLMIDALPYPLITFFNEIHIQIM